MGGGGGGGGEGIDWWGTVEECLTVRVANVSLNDGLTQR